MVKTNPLSVKDITNYAKQIRQSYKIKEDECFPIFDYIDYLCANGYLSMQIIADDDKYLDSNTVALYNSYDNFIYVKESVIDEIESGNYRSNFTLAHELFHYIQNKVLGFDFERVEEEKVYEDPEWQANVFAGELLLPTDALQIDDNEYLASHYKVSFECVLTRKVKNKKREEYKSVK